MSEKQPEAWEIASDADHFAGWLERRSLPSEDVRKYADCIRTLNAECLALRIVAENTVSLLEHLTAHANLSARNYVICERVLVQAREHIAKEQP